MSVDNPLKWLLKELPDYIAPASLADLMERYEANKKAYARQIKINQAERMIKIYERRDVPYEAASIARWREKLARLQEESS
jgi:hypothetical protein